MTQRRNRALLAAAYSKDATFGRAQRLTFKLLGVLCDLHNIRYTLHTQADEELRCGQQDADERAANAGCKNLRHWREWLFADNFDASRAQTAFHIQDQRVPGEHIVIVHDQHIR